MTAAHVLNRCPTKRLNSMVPKEAWSGSKPLVKHFKIFGSLCYRHATDQKRKALNDKSEPMIFVGYNSTGTYKLYNPKTKEVLFSRDVYFDESKSWSEPQAITETIPRLQLDWEEIDSRKEATHGTLNCEVKDYPHEV